MPGATFSSRSSFRTGSERFSLRRSSSLLHHADISLRTAMATSLRRSTSLSFDVPICCISTGPPLKKVDEPLHRDFPLRSSFIVLPLSDLGGFPSYIFQICVGSWVTQVG
ncbi:unnamed protein product [Cuscuta europaea]|uniref:Uncharacterized protein n=1 Tax=Cuscuta europaea TaxID=41803 RepID=A0A9P1E6Q4_CUSEU|nr:unnamed protein product [Cuscuta europaea]